MTDTTEQPTYAPVLLTAAVRDLIGHTTEVTEMYGTVDLETVRRYIVGIPDQDPRHWDTDLASDRFGGTTCPGAMVTYIAYRKPPWEPDEVHKKMLDDWFSDGGGIARAVKGLPSIRSVAPTRRQLHAGDEIEILRYPRIGDRVYFQSKYADIEEKTGKDGTPFLLITKEIRFWNQNDETLCIIRTISIER